MAPGGSPRVAARKLTIHQSERNLSGGAAEAVVGNLFLSGFGVNCEGGGVRNHKILILVNDQSLVLKSLERAGHNFPNRADPSGELVVGQP